MKRTNIAVIAVVVGMAATVANAGAAFAAAIPISANGQTEHVGHAGDAADDPAIWRNDDEPGESRVIGTDKQGALHVYRLDGSRIQTFTTTPAGVPFKANNVDVVGDIVGATNNQGGGNVVFYRAHRDDGRLYPIAGAIDPGVPAYGEHGLCMYDDDKATPDTLYAYVLGYTSGADDAPSTLEQWRVTFSGNTLSKTRVRTITAPDFVKAEGCAVDDRPDPAADVLYVGVERRGLYRFSAAASGGNAHTIVDKTTNMGGDHILPDLEGVTLGGPLLIVSAQAEDDADSRFVVYDRYTMAFLGEFRVTGGAIDDCDHTDGIDATAASLGPQFPGGIFVCQDGTNDDDGVPNRNHQNFKLVKFGRITSMFT